MLAEADCFASSPPAEAWGEQLKMRKSFASVHHMRQVTPHTDRQTETHTRSTVSASPRGRRRGTITRKAHGRPRIHACMENTPG